MKFGLAMFATDYAIRIDELARAAEERSFESLWVPEHTHIPVSRKSPWGGGGELPQEYWHTHDPFISLMAAAGATRTLKIATGVCLIIERDTIVTAKEVASLDALSDGRLLFGIGAGWNAEEMENHGTEFASRFRKMEEQVRAMKEIWSRDEPEFHGRFVEFDPIWCWPKPAQKPHPPIHLGGTGSRTLQRVVDLCDGWMPIGRGDPEPLTRLVPELRERAATAGRAMSTIELSVFGGVSDPAGVDRFREAGFERVILRLPSSGRDDILPLLDRYAKLMAGRVSPAIDAAR